MPNNPAKASHCYAIRRVNPFLGVLQVVETADGRAISSNGLVWNIELRTEQHGGWGSLARTSSHSAHLRYGQWSEAGGLVRHPLQLQLDMDQLAEQCDQLTACVERYVDELPFALQDTRELWLFDSAGQQPIALLASMIPGTTPPRPEPRYWLASPRGGGSPGLGRFPASDRLQERVRHRAGFNTDKRWITRTAEGDGDLDRNGQRIAAAQFPVYLLREDWEADKDTHLVREYLGWIAPALLTLQRLSDSDRSRMEENLGIQALRIEHHWRLFPRVINKEVVNAARVNARLQHAVEDGQHEY